VNEFIADLRTTLKTIQADPTMTADTAQTLIQGVVDQYDALLGQLSAPAGCQAKYDVIGA
jgi:hypothetical protein